MRCFRRCPEPRDADPACVGQKHSGNQLKRCCFPAAIGAKQCIDLASVNLQRDTVEGVNLATSFSAEKIKERRSVPLRLCDVVEADCVTGLDELVHAFTVRGSLRARFVTCLKKT